MSEETHYTSSEIFYQFCQAKPKEATLFINDYILYQLDIPKNFDGEEYAGVKQYILDFMVGCDQIFKFYFYFLSLQIENLNMQTFARQFEIELKLNNQALASFFFGIFMSNIDKLFLLKAKKISQFDEEELQNYNLNVQMELGHSNISSIENEFKVLFKIQKNNKQNDIFEIDEKELDSFITKLKDIYCQIKN